MVKSSANGKPLKNVFCFALTIGALRGNHCEVPFFRLCVPILVRRLIGNMLNLVLADGTGQILNK